MGQPREYHQTMVHYLRKTVTFADNGTEVTVGWLPAGAVILEACSGVVVTTVFNGDTTNTVDIGANVGNDDPDEWLDGGSLETAGFVPLATNVGTYVMSEATEITASVVSTASASAGVAEIVICYLPDNDG